MIRGILATVLYLALGDGQDCPVRMARIESSADYSLALCCSVNEVCLSCRLGLLQNANCSNVYSFIRVSLFCL
jgi:hypothetical protein